MRSGTTSVDATGERSTVPNDPIRRSVPQDAVSAVELDQLVDVRLRRGRPTTPPPARTDAPAQHPTRSPRPRPPSASRSYPPSRKAITAAPGHRRDESPIRSAKSPAVSPRLASGSARWPSKPAEISSHVGANRSTAGATTSSNARRWCSAVAPGRQRDVDGVPGAGAGAGLVQPPGPRVQRPLVPRHEQHPVVVVEHVLGAVAVVGVDVGDQHPLAPRRPGAPRSPRRCSSGRSPSTAARRGVVARRPDRTERGVGRRRATSASTAVSPAPAASSAACHDAGHHDRVGVELPPAGGTRRLDLRRASRRRARRPARRSVASRGRPTDQRVVEPRVGDARRARRRAARAAPGGAARCRVRRTGDR